MDAIKKAEKRLGVMKAEVNIEELKFKILERETDIERINSHIEKQHQLIVKLKAELSQGE